MLLTAFRGMCSICLHIAAPSLIWPCHDQGLQLLHYHHTAHWWVYQLLLGTCNYLNFCFTSDIKINNIMMDPTPVFSDIPHPMHWYQGHDFKHNLRTQTHTSHPTRYFYINFGLLWRVPPNDPSPQVLVSKPKNKTVPEFEGPGPFGYYADPYKIDMYCLGNLIHEHFMNIHIFITARCEDC